MVRGLLRLRDEVAELCTVQVTAFPQDGIFARDGDEERLENALRLGVDCVGGIPHYEPTSELGLQGGASRVRAREAVLAPHRRALRRDGRPELALPRGDGRRHGEVRARRPRHRVALHRDGLVRAVLLVEAARVPAPRGHQHRRQSVRELAHPGPARRLSEATRLRAAEGAARSGRQRVARQRRDHGSVVPARPRRHGRGRLARAALHVHERARGDPGDAPLRDRARRPHARRRGRVRDRGRASPPISSSTTRRARSRCCACIRRAAG